MPIGQMSSEGLQEITTLRANSAGVVAQYGVGAWQSAGQEGLKEAVAILRGFKGPAKPGWAMGTLGLSF